MITQQDVASDEELGRSVSSSRNAARARRSRVPYREFLPPPGRNDISVDRLSVATPTESEEIADSRDKVRGRTFYGWAVVTAEAAGENGRQVLASPIADVNPYHADIILPEDEAENRNAQRRHAQQLSDASRWRERPSVQEELRR